MVPHDMPAIRNAPDVAVVELAANDPATAFPMQVDEGLNRMAVTIPGAYRDKDVPGIDSIKVEGVGFPLSI